MVDRWGWCVHTADVPNLLRAFNPITPTATSVPNRALRGAPPLARRRSYAATARRTSTRLRTHHGVVHRPPPFDVPGHGTTPEFRTEGEANEMLDAVPGLREACTRARGPGFEFEHLQFDPVSIPGRSPKGKAQLVFRHMPVDAATPLANASPEDLRRVEHGDPVEKISIAITSQDEGGACVHVVGPFDVLRVLAYELDAPWS